MIESKLAELVLELDHEEALADQKRSESYNYGKSMRAEWGRKMYVGLSPEDCLAVDALKAIYEERDRRRDEIKHRVATWDALVFELRGMLDQFDPAGARPSCDAPREALEKADKR